MPQRLRETKRALEKSSSASRYLQQPTNRRGVAEIDCLSGDQDKKLSVPLAELDGRSQTLPVGSSRYLHPSSSMISLNW